MSTEITSAGFKFIHADNTVTELDGIQEVLNAVKAIFACEVVATFTGKTHRQVTE